MSFISYKQLRFENGRWRDKASKNNQKSYVCANLYYFILEFCSFKWDTYLLDMYNRLQFMSDLRRRYGWWFLVADIYDRPKWCKLQRPLTFLNSPCLLVMVCLLMCYEFDLPSLSHPYDSQGGVLLKWGRLSRGAFAYYIVLFYAPSSVSFLLKLCKRPKACPRGYMHIFKTNTWLEIPFLRYWNLVLCHNAIW